LSKTPHNPFLIIAGIISRKSSIIRISLLQASFISGLLIPGDFHFGALMMDIYKDCSPQVLEEIGKPSIQRIYQKDVLG